MTKFACKLALIPMLASGLAVNARADWPHILDSGPSTFDAGYAVTIDAKGYVYVAGYFDTTDLNGNMMVAKYDRLGNYYWTSSWDSPQHKYDVAKYLVVDPAGNVTVAGESRGTSTDTHALDSTDIVLASWDSNGDFRWATALEGSGGGNDTAAALVLDKDNNVIVAGTTLTDSNTSDAMVAKFSSSGTYLWDNTYSGPGSFDDSAKSLALDSHGNVFLAAEVFRTASKEDIDTIKFSKDGEQQWAKSFDGGDKDTPASIKVDSNGDAIVAGSSMSANGSWDVELLKYKTTKGQKLFQTRAGFASYNEVAKDLAVGASGNSYVAGTATPGSGYSDVLTVKFDAAGDKQWIKRYDAVPKNGSVDEGVAVSVDNDGNVFVAATLLEFAGSNGPAFGCIKYNNGGNLLFGKRYSITGDDSVALGMALDREKGKVYITGYSINIGDSYFDLAIAKF